jgi:hypothetical protein
MRIYMSGSIQFEPNHREIFEAVEMTLVSSPKVTGVVNPLKVPACPTEDCYRSSWTRKGTAIGRAAPFQWNSNDPKPTPEQFREAGYEFKHGWECYMKYDIKAMLTCDGIYMIRGWHTSPGARLEQFVAASCGLKIYFDLEEVQ